MLYSHGIFRLRLITLAKEHKKSGLIPHFCHKSICFESRIQFIIYSSIFVSRIKVIQLSSLTYSGTPPYGLFVNWDISCFRNNGHPVNASNIQLAKSQLYTLYNFTIVAAVVKKKKQWRRTDFKKLQLERKYVIMILPLKTDRWRINIRRQKLFCIS